MLEYKDVQIDRDENHIYYVDGIKKTGATELLKNSGLIPGIEFVSEEALWRGSVVHEMCRLINKKTIDYSTIDPTIQPYGAAYESFLIDTGFQPRYWEQKLWHSTLDFCGQIDVLGQVKDEWWIIDYKSSLNTRAIARWVGYQLALYQILVLRNYDTFPNISRLRRFGLKLMATGKYNLVPFSDPNDFSVALASINIKNGRS